MPKLHHYDYLGTARFITFSCYRRYPVFRNVSAAEIFINHLSALRIKYKIKIHGYVVMPEHIHLVLHPPDSVKLGLVIGQLKARSALNILASWRGELLQIPQELCLPDNHRANHAIWQRRCYDHNCRTSATVREKINYCHNNPVQRGLVKEPGEWRWSSYGAYRGEGEVPLEIDPISPI